MRDYPRLIWSAAAALIFVLAPGYALGSDSASGEITPQEVWDSFTIGDARQIEGGDYLACHDAAAEMVDIPFHGSLCIDTGGVGFHWEDAKVMSLHEITAAWVGTGYRHVGAEPAPHTDGSRLILYVRSIASAPSTPD